MKALIGHKVGMTSQIKNDGTVQPVTVLKAGPVTVTQVKSVDKDGYDAVQVGFGRHKKPGKALVGHSKPAKVDAPRYIREFKTDDVDQVSVGDSFDVSIFSEGDSIKVTGISKGKGFAGTIKRHNFQRGPKTHGSRNYRKPGSIGSMYPQKIFKGKRMAGRMGAQQVSVKNQKVAFVDKDNNLLGIIGTVPGPNRSVITVERA